MKLNIRNVHLIFPGTSSSCVPLQWDKLSLNLRVSKEGEEL